MRGEAEIDHESTILEHQRFENPKSQIQESAAQHERRAARTNDRTELAVFTLEGRVHAARAHLADVLLRRVAGNAGQHRAPAVSNQEMHMRAEVGLLVLGLALAAPAGAAAQAVTRHDVADRIEDRADRREDRRDRREDVRDRREDRRDARHDGGIRDRREDVRDRREDVRDRREERHDRREERRDRRR
jgi:hypothetical protein